MAIAALIILAIAAFLMAWPGLWWFLAKSFNSVPSVGPLSGKDAEDWNTYSDPDLEYRFKYPQGSKVVDNSRSPVMDGAKKEIVVEKNDSQKKPDVFFTVDLFDDALMGVGGIDFSMNGDTGSIGCAYGNFCRIYLEGRNAVVSIKSSPYPWLMMDGESKKILATLSFEPSQSDKNQ